MQELTSLVALTDDVLLTLAFIIGEDRLPIRRSGRVLKWESPIAGAAINLRALSCASHVLHELIAPSIATLRNHLLTELRRVEGNPSMISSRFLPALLKEERAPLAEETLLLWRSALLSRDGRGAVVKDEGEQQRAAAAATERELAQLDVQPSYSASAWRPLTTPRRLRHAGEMPTEER